MVDVRQRTLYQAGVAADHMTKTLIACAMTAVMFPGGVRGNGRAEAKRLEFYATLASGHDPDKIFQPPPTRMPMHSRTGRGLEDAGGRVELLRFHSPFEPLHPDAGDHFRPTDRNATARAQYWRHDDGPRPTLIATHGLGASAADLNARVFSLREFFDDGWDIMLYTLPFHGGRQSNRSPFNGAEMFSGGFAALAEAFLQAISEMRVLIDFLEHRGAPRIGATGLSLGGYTTALLASVDPRLDFAIPNSAVTSIPKLIERWFPANLGTGLMQQFKHVPTELLARSAAIHSPLNYTPKLPTDRLLIIAGTGDRVAPPSQSRALWEHWQRPAIHWYAGSHVLHLGRVQYLASMRETMGPPEPPPPRPGRQPLPAVATAMGPGQVPPPSPAEPSALAAPLPLRPRRPHT